MNVKLAHFDLLEEIGHGGLGLVFKAFDPSLNRHVAIKLLKDEHAQDPKFVESFLREARSAAAISHPHIAQIHFVGEFEGSYYLVMEFVEGRSLEHMVRMEGPLPEAKALGIIIEVAEALKAGYVNQMIHGDIKPQNIVVGKDTGAKLLDFGLAQLANVEVDASDGVWGSPYYISPERVGRKAEDFRSDVYSLGATLFEALTGRPPFDAEDPTELALKRLNEKPPLLRALNPNISKRTEQVVDKMLQKNLLMRYLDYDSLVKDLRKAEAAALGNAPKQDTAELRRATGYMTGQIPVPPQRSLFPAILAATIVSTLIIAGILYFLFNKKPAAPVLASNPATPTPSIVPGATPLPMTNGSKMVQFNYRSSTAKSVMLVGNLNRWQPEPMKQMAGDSSIWVLSKEVPLGVAIEYQFIVDGLFIADPARAGANFPDGKGSFKTVWDPSATPTPESKVAEVKPAIPTPAPAASTPSVSPVSAATPTPSPVAAATPTPTPVVGPEFKAGIQHVEQLAKEFKIKEAEFEIRKLKASNPAETDAANRMYRFTNAEKGFLLVLGENLPRKKYPAAIEKRDGTKVEGGATRINDDGVFVSTPSGEVLVRFKEITVSSLLAMADNYFVPTAPLDVITGYKWNSGLVAFLLDSKTQGKARMVEALKANPKKYQKDFELIHETQVDLKALLAAAAAAKTPAAPTPSVGPVIPRRLVYTGFEYPITNNIGTITSARSDIGLSSGTWTSSNKVVPGLSYTGLRTIGNAIQFSSTIYAAHGINTSAMPPGYTQVDNDMVVRFGEPGTTLWVRFLMRSDVPDADAALVGFMALTGARSASAIEIGATGGYWGMRKGGGFLASKTPVVTGSTVLLVAKLQFGLGKKNDEISLYINSMGVRPPAMPDVVISNIDIGAFDQFQFKANRPMTADEFSIATDWSAL